MQAHVSGSEENEILQAVKTFLITRLADRRSGTLRSLFLIAQRGDGDASTRLLHVFFLLLRIHSDTAAVQISQRAVIFGVGSQLEICTVVINQELFASRKEYSYFACSPVYTRCGGVMVRFETRLDATLPGSCFTRNPRRLHDIIVFHGMKLGLC